MGYNIIEIIDDEIEGAIQEINEATINSQNQ